MRRREKERKKEEKVDISGSKWRRWWRPWWRRWRRLNELRLTKASKEYLLRRRILRYLGPKEGRKAGRKEGRRKRSAGSGANYCRHKAASHQMRWDRRGFGREGIVG